MVRKGNIYMLLLLVALLSLAGCRSSKSGVAGDSDSVAALSQLKGMQAIDGGVQGLSAKVKMSLNAGRKSGSVSGTMKMLGETGVYVAVTPLGFIEVANVAFLPAYVQAVNKLKGEYSQVKYSDVQLLHNLGLDYALLESVLMNRIYIPGGKDVAKSLKEMNISQENGNILLSCSSKGVEYRYFIDSTTGLLVRSEGIHANGTGVTCEYSSFVPVGDKQFPTQITLQLGAPATKAALSLSLSRVSPLGRLEVPAPSARYKKVTTNDILESLLGK